MSEHTAAALCAQGRRERGGEILPRGCLPCCSIPALLAVWLACRLRGARMVIDWHNFGYTVLGLSLGRDHPLVKFSLVYERFFARRADGHICVTDAMRQWMRSQWGVT